MNGNHWQFCGSDFISYYYVHIWTKHLSDYDNVSNEFSL